MIITTATATGEEMGPLGRIVTEWAEMNEKIAKGEGCTVADWEPLAKFVDVDKFERVGVHMEVMNWNQYLKFLAEWGGTTNFEATLKRISEVGRCVFFEIVEYHRRGEKLDIKNVIAVYEFNDDNKVIHLDLYQQATDSGEWYAKAIELSQE